MVNINTVNPKKFFSEEEESKIVNAIQAAEKNTSGEIRLHIERKIKGDIYAAAVKIFDKLKMYKTAQRNGCLILLDLTNHRFAVIGDKGINEIAPENFWNDVVAIIGADFKNGLFVEGLTKGILKIGDKLKEFFPYQSDDINELPDEISKGE